MKKIDFFSEGYYLYLPTINNPKVILNIENRTISENAFKLYNPFSNKAKCLKSIIQFFFLNSNNFAKAIFSAKRKKKSEFINFLEIKLNKSLKSSIYIATVKDKVVLQLQENNRIIGYLKYPIKETGIKHLLNEYKAIQILSKKKIVEPLLLFDYYKERPYLLIKELFGAIKDVKNSDLKTLLQRFKKQKKYVLKEHPRMIQLKSKLKNYGLDNYIVNLNSLSNSSKELYYEVYEHGDFAPWNLITNNNQIIPFDFEYFVENGLEHMDLIKYYYQIGKLLKNKRGNDLLDFVQNQFDLPEISVLIQIFLIKEILISHEEGLSFKEESNSLNSMSLK